ncbi:MAG: 5'-3' exonuclease H3TH domain-containing protein, partial [Traorella sp.]
MSKILLVDGNAMLFRAYYASKYGNTMSTSNGIPTNAVYGFIIMLKKAMELIQPEYICVAWDSGKPTFRHESYEAYKGTRKQLDDELIVQMPLVREYLDSAHIFRYEQEGIEADDIIGSLSKKYREHETIILTSDRDLLQLIDDTTSVLLMKKGITDMHLVDEKECYESFQVTPSQIIELKGLMGDSSDNIPGVKGIGEKTAIKLLHEYTTVENIYEHL